MGHYHCYVDVWVTPEREDGVWYLNIDGNLYEKHGAQRVLWESNTQYTRSLSFVYATYSGGYSMNQWVEDDFAISVSAGTGGTLTASKSRAAAGETITLTPTPSNGYVFKDYTKSPNGLSISGNQFTMPNQNVSIMANFWKLSTGSLSSKNLTGGSNVTLTITMQSTALKHYYNLSFGSGMSTGDVPVNAGVSSETFTVPLNWSAQIPNATSKGSGTLTLKTYNGNTLLGSTTITGITYNVPASVKPSIGTITTSIARTIDGVTYADIGEVYAQNHCGVRVQASASGEQSATITSLTIKVGSYDGNKYNRTKTGNDSTLSDDWTSGLLGTAGTITITVTATDSRARTNSASVTITVSAYAKPSGSLQVWRVNNGGTTDDMGVYGMYQLTKQFSEIGNNSLSWTLAVSGQSKSSPEATGNLLPENRLEFSQTQEYTVTLTLTDGLETTIIVASLPSARFIMAFDSTGNKIGIMKFPNKTIPSGKHRTFEFSDDTQIYIGNQTLEDYILDVMNN